MASSIEHPLRSIGAPTTLSKSLLHAQHEEIEAHVNQYLSDTWEWPSKRHKLGFLSWKLSDTALRMFATGEYVRVKLACELLLLGFLMDGKSNQIQFPPLLEEDTQLKSEEFRLV